MGLTATPSQDVYSEMAKLWKASLHWLSGVMRRSLRPPLLATATSLSFNKKCGNPGREQSGQWQGRVPHQPANCRFQGALKLHLFCYTETFQVQSKGAPRGHPTTGLPWLGLSCAHARRKPRKGTDRSLDVTLWRAVIKLRSSFQKGKTQGWLLNTSPAWLL